MRIIILLLMLAVLVSCTIEEARSAYGQRANGWDSEIKTPPVTFSDNLHPGSWQQDREMAILLRQRFCQADVNTCAGVESIKMTRQGEFVYLSASQDNAVHNYQVVTAGCLWSASCQLEFELRASY